MKLQDGMYKVTIGYKSGETQADNWSSVNVMARDAARAIKRVALERGEYIAEVHLVERLDERTAK